MKPALPRLGHILLTLDQQANLLAHLVQMPKYLLVPVGERQDGVRDARLVAELPHERLHLAQVVPGHAGEEVVDGLELQAAVHKVHPGGAVDVHGGPELALGEGLALAQVGGGHAPVGEGDLDVQRHGDDVADEDEDDAGGPGRDVAPAEDVAEEEPVAGHEGDLGRADPPCRGGP